MNQVDRSATESWLPPPERPVALDDEVQVWRIFLDLPASEIDEMKGVLSNEEKARAARFAFEKHRARFISGRASLRRILARYLGRAPQRLEFGYGHRGKPYLKDDPPGNPLRFNLSHSSELALLAVVGSRDIGVDVERVRAVQYHLKIAGRFFSPGEVATIRALPPEVQYEAFFNCWTRKEAYIKALGDGLAYPLDAFEVSLAPGTPAALLRVNDDPNASTEWFMKALDPGHGYVGAVALKGTGYRVTRWEWGETERRVD